MGSSRLEQRLGDGDAAGPRVTLPTVHELPLANLLGVPTVARRPPSVFSSGEEAAKFIRLSAEPSTPEQRALARRLELRLDPATPRPVAAAIIEDHVVPLARGLEREDATGPQLAFLAELAPDLGTAGMSKGVAGAWIASSPSSGRIVSANATPDGPRAPRRGTVRRGPLDGARRVVNGPRVGRRAAARPLGLSAGGLEGQEASSSSPWPRLPSARLGPSLAFGRRRLAWPPRRSPRAACEGGSCLTRWLRGG